MAARNKPVPVVLNPSKGSKFREETVLVSFTENQVLVEVVGKTGRGKGARYPRKALLDLNIADTEQINQAFAEAAPANKEAAAPKNGRKKKTARKKVGKKKTGKKAGKKAGRKKKTGKKAGKKATTKKTTTRKEGAKKAKPTNGRRKKTASSKKDSETFTPPRRTKDSPATSPDPWGEAWD